MPNRGDKPDIGRVARRDGHSPIRESLMTWLEMWGWDRPHMPGDPVPVPEGTIAHDDRHRRPRDSGAYRLFALLSLGIDALTKAAAASRIGADVRVSGALWPRPSGGREAKSRREAPSGACSGLWAMPSHRATAGGQAARSRRRPARGPVHRPRLGLHLPRGQEPAALRARTGPRGHMRR
jgi:hypothetical protein